MSTKPKRKRMKFTGGAKVTLAALSMIGFVGGWDLIARLDKQEAQASPPSPAGSENRLMEPSPTPWSTIPPLAEIPPIPTLAPAQAAISPGDSLQSNRQNDSLASAAPVQMAPVPTLAPLPALAPLPPMPKLPPPPPPPAQTWTGGGNSSGGS